MNVLSYSYTVFMVLVGHLEIAVSFCENEVCNCVYLVLLLRRNGKTALWSNFYFFFLP